MEAHRGRRSHGVQHLGIPHGHLGQYLQVLLRDAGLARGGHGLDIRQLRHEVIQHTVVLQFEVSAAGAGGGTVGCTRGLRAWGRRRGQREARQAAKGVGEVSASVLHDLQSKVAAYSL